MKLSELYVGQVVRVITFDGWEDRPGHWNEEGDMDEWRGELVTIADIVNHEIYLEEDEGEWCWYAQDFMFYENLPPEDPNIRYKRKKENAWLKTMREEVRLRIERDKKELS